MKYSHYFKKVLQEEVGLHEIPVIFGVEDTKLIYAIAALLSGSSDSILYIPFEYIDVYRVLELCGVTNPSIAHAVKKLLVAGNRGHKDLEKDVQEAIDSLIRWQDMRKEDAELYINFNSSSDKAEVAYAIYLLYQWQRTREEELVRQANVCLDKIEIVAYAKSPEKSLSEDNRQIIQKQIDMYMGLDEEPQVDAIAMRGQE
jgi:hypothetical protein